ncbi:GTP-binding protein [Candidatus Micrarchaeota archaeon]|nr:GTP-binding protein [Candidatus Micrarchaeota archaeon]
MGLQEKLKELEDELARTQKNKATEYHIGIVKSKIAQIRRELLSPKKGGASGGGFDVKKSGDATVALIGLPSVGKSTLLNRLTNAESKTAAYAFTTLKCIPGTLEYNNTKIQILDLPGIIEGAKDGKGRGREVIAVARGVDLILVMLEATHPEQRRIIETELYGFGIRVNSRRPRVNIGKAIRGGVTINHTVPITKISDREIMATLSSYSIFNANVVLHQDVTVDEFIDVLEGNRSYVPVIYLLTKFDTIKEKPKVDFEYLPISADNKESIEKLKATIYKRLDLISIFTKRRGEDADLTEPMIVRRGISISEVCEKLHRDLKKDFRYALVWGTSVKHQPQRVGIYHILDDKDVVQIIKR